jgi:hypothetical protein
VTCSCRSISRTTRQKDSILDSRVFVPFAHIPMPFVPILPAPPNDAAGAVCNNTPPRTIHAAYATCVVMMTWRAARERSKGV